MKKKLNLTLLLIALVSALPMHAQKKYLHKYEDEIDHQQIVLAQGDSIQRFHVSSLKSTIDIKEELDYYWYEQRQVHITQGNYIGELLEGAYQLLTYDKKLVMKGQFHHGVKDGDWYQWRSNGKLKSISKWSNGKKEGLTKEYDATGKLIKEIHYHQNELHGKLVYHQQDTSFTHHYKHGKLVMPDEVKKLSKIKNLLKKIYPPKEIREQRKLEREVKKREKEKAKGKTQTKATPKKQSETKKTKQKTKGTK